MGELVGVVDGGEREGVGECTGLGGLVDECSVGQFDGQDVGMVDVGEMY